MCIPSRNDSFLIQLYMEKLCVYYSCVGNIFHFFINIVAVLKFSAHLETISAHSEQFTEAEVASDQMLARLCIWCWATPGNQMLSHLQHKDRSTGGISADASSVVW